VSSSTPSLLYDTSCGTAVPNSVTRQGLSVIFFGTLALLSVTDFVSNPSMRGWGLDNKAAPSSAGFCVIPISPTNGNQMSGAVTLGGVRVCYQAAPTKTKRVLSIRA